MKQNSQTITLPASVGRADNRLRQLAPAAREIFEAADMAGVREYDYVLIITGLHDYRQNRVKLASGDGKALPVFVSCAQVLLSYLAEMTASGFPTKARMELAAVIAGELASYEEAVQPFRKRSGREAEAVVIKASLEFLHSRQ